MERETQQTIIAISLITFLFAFFVLLLVVFEEAQESEYDNFCQEKGFEEATDYKIDSYYNVNQDYNLVNIECGKGNIFFDLSCEDGYACEDDDKNKWGNCIGGKVKICSEHEWKT